MSKREKLIAKIKNNPNNVKFKDLKKLLLSEGFEVRQPRGGSSHYIFKKKGIGAYPVPKENPVNEHYIKDLIKKLGL